MDPKAGFHLYDKEESLKAFHLREQLKSYELSPGIINTFLERNAQECTEYLTKIRRQPIGFLNVLKGIEDWLRAKNIVPSKAQTVAQTMVQVCANPILMQGISNYKAGKIKNFITYYDFSEGMMEAVTSLYFAIRILDGTEQGVSDEASIRWLQHRKVIPSGVMDKLDYMTDKEHQYFADILKEDPSGLKVVAEMLRELTIEMEFKKNNPSSEFPYPRMLPYQYPKLYVAGANFAKQIYEGLYQLWEDKQCSSN